MSEFNISKSTNKSDLLRHARTNHICAHKCSFSGENPFPCSRCKNQFTNYDNSTTHKQSYREKYSNASSGKIHLIILEAQLHTNAALVKKTHSHAPSVKINLLIMII